jgi:parallel beta-helix repeat protein
VKKRKLDTRILVGFEILIVAGFATSAFATTLEVNQNDATKFQTIAAAIGASQPGDTILVHPGTYQEIVTFSGLTLTAQYGPEVTVITPPFGQTGTGVTLTGNQDVQLKGFRIQGFSYGIYVNTSGGNPVVENCVVAGNSGPGVYLGTSVPTTATIANNTVADNGGDGFYSTLRYVTLSGLMNNIVYRNGGYAFYTLNSIFGDTSFGDYNCYRLNTKGGFNPPSSSGTNSAGAHSITTDPLVNPVTYYRFNSQASPCVNTGNPSPSYNNPDNSRNTMGAYGGPGAANWWRDPFTGPTVTNVTVNPPQVPPGGTVTIQATATTP